MVIIQVPSCGVTSAAYCTNADIQVSSCDVKLPHAVGMLTQNKCLVVMLQMLHDV
jgi:hypothetical protein